MFEDNITIIHPTIMVTEPLRQAAGCSVTAKGPGLRLQHARYVGLAFAWFTGLGALAAVIKRMKGLLGCPRAENMCPLMPSGKPQMLRPEVQSERIRQMEWPSYEGANSLGNFR